MIFKTADIIFYDYFTLSCKSWKFQKIIYILPSPSPYWEKLQTTFIGRRRQLRGLSQLEGGEDHLQDDGAGDEDRSDEGASSHLLRQLQSHHVAAVVEGEWPTWQHGDQPEVHLRTIYMYYMYKLYIELDVCKIETSSENFYHHFDDIYCYIKLLYIEGQVCHTSI